MNKLFSLLIFLQVSLCAGVGYAQTIRTSCPEFAKYYAKDSINIITFGASTVEGVNGQNFQTPLTKMFLNCYKKEVINIENRGISGQTTGECLKRIQGAVENKTGFIVILAGANDAIRIETGKLTLKETEANMRQIIITALNQQLTPIICTIQFFDDRTRDDLKQINRHVIKINALYKKLAKEYDIDLADLNAVIKRDFSLYQDFVHPNEKGNKLIATTLYAVINRIISEKFVTLPTQNIGYGDLKSEFPTYSASQSYPNPTKNGFASIDIVAPQPDEFVLDIFDLQGKMVSTITTAQLKVGKHILKVDLSKQPAGVYIYKIKAKSGLFTDTKKLIRAY
ncbi:GDSL-type esterase/lipase family protein [Nubsella zeaxanthinifaciens]|jgi:acyl-CoA thioesterase-1|uniref:GDSL-type esterase/lipase family protein n=1 Tax=Nubsella zeaxanthinifaciens TaxID=392412 RepID=UPI000DE287CC|nr:GDSL-type esterase/lipase family protein [Nubsella zeaxanthinifaciens]